MQNYPLAWHFELDLKLSWSFTFWIWCGAITSLRYLYMLIWGYPLLCILCAGFYLRIRSVPLIWTIHWMEQVLFKDELFIFYLTPWFFFFFLISFKNSWEPIHSFVFSSSPTRLSSHFLKLRWIKHATVSRRANWALAVPHWVLDHRLLTVTPLVLRYELRNFFDCSAVNSWNDYGVVSVN